MKIKSGFALLDVLGKDGRLFKAVEKGQHFKVVIEGELDAVAGNHDGESREYTVLVEKVTARPVTKGDVTS